MEAVSAFLAGNVTGGYATVVATVAGLAWLVTLWVSGRSSRTSVLGLGHGTSGFEKHTLTADKYTELFDKHDGEHRKSQYEQVVNSYYDLATDFYEYGWGTSFHFAQRTASESLYQSLARHEHFLAARLGLHRGQRAIDIGCGVGGPAREIARFSGAAVTGLNNNAYQITRATKLTTLEGVRGVDFQKGDFMNIPFGDNTFDAAYAIEATCHAPDRVGCYAEILRVTKPGGHFAGYEWCTTDRWDGAQPAHEEIKQNILVGNGLPDLMSTADIVACLREAGWDVLEYSDLAQPLPHYPVPWYEPFNGTWSLSGFRTTWLGIQMTNALVYVLETLRLAPKGTMATQQFLIKGAQGLLAGGRTGTFTPMFYFLARKPESAAPARGRAASSQTKSPRSSSNRRSPRRK